MMRSCSSFVSLSCRMFFLEVNCFYIGQGLLIGSWLFRVAWPWRYFSIEVLHSILGLLRGPGLGFSLLDYALVTVCLWFLLGLPQLSLRQTYWFSVGETCKLWRLYALGLLLQQVCQNFWLPKRAFLGVTAGIWLTSGLSGPWLNPQHLVHWWC